MATRWVQWPRYGEHVRGAGEDLHSVWDTCLIERGLGEDPRTVAHTLLSDITAAQRANWTATPVVSWVNESFFVARMSSVQYCVSSATTCIYAPGNVTFQKGVTQRAVMVDAVYISMHEPLVTARLKQAGVRLAHLLNTTLGR